jgi:hypothetical protein
LKTKSITLSHINSANSFLQIYFPILFSPLTVSVDKTSISSIRNTEEYAQWKSINPGIDDSTVDIALAQIVKSPTYFARMFFTSKSKLPQIDLNGLDGPTLPSSSMQELTSRLVSLKSNHAWFVDFTDSLTDICQHYDLNVK